MTNRMEVEHDLCCEGERAEKQVWGKSRERRMHELEVQERDDKPKGGEGESWREENPD